MRLRAQHGTKVVKFNQVPDNLDYNTVLLFFDELKPRNSQDIDCSIIHHMYEINLAN